MRAQHEASEAEKTKILEEFKLIQYEVRQKDNQIYQLV